MELNAQLALDNIQQKPTKGIPVFFCNIMEHAHIDRIAGVAPINRLDHDMADSRGTLVSIKSLDEIWFPHFARCIEPMLKTDVKLIWHCDGNLMEMVPRAASKGFRGSNTKPGWTTRIYAR